MTRLSPQLLALSGDPRRRGVGSNEPNRAVPTAKFSPAQRQISARSMNASLLSKTRKDPTLIEGRPAQYIFRGLFGVLSRCGLHTPLSPIRSYHDCSDYFRPERFARWDLHPLESAALARCTPGSDIAPTAPYGALRLTLCETGTGICTIREYFPGRTSLRARGVHVAVDPQSLFSSRQSPACTKTRVGDCSSNRPGPPPASNDPWPMGGLAFSF